MNLRALILGCGVLLAVGCSPSNEEDLSTSHFYLDNQTDQSLRIEWTERDNPDAEPGIFGPVPAGGSREFTAENTGAFFAPQPSVAFASVSLVREDTGARVYVQEPIQDDKWRKESIQVRLSEFRTQYILTVRSEDLTTP